MNILPAVKDLLFGSWDLQWVPSPGNNEEIKVIGNTVMWKLQSPYIIIAITNR